MTALHEATADKLRRQEWHVGPTTASKDFGRGVSAITWADGTWNVIQGGVPVAHGKEINLETAAMEARDKAERLAGTRQR